MSRRDILPLPVPFIKLMDAVIPQAIYNGREKSLKTKQ